MPTLVETRAQHRERITRAVAELDRLRARFDALTAGIDWQAMTREDRERVEEIDLDIAIAEHEIGMEMGAIWRGDHGIF